MEQTYRPRNYNNRRQQPVEDLREKLNRKKQEKTPGGEGSKNAPPPDPAYNFLKDPLRDNDSHDFTNKTNKKGYNKFVNNERDSSGHYQKNSLTTKTSPKGNSANFQRETHHEHHRQYERKSQNREDHPKNGDQRHSGAQQLLTNIKIELSSDSGARKCTFDENKTIEVPVIKQDHGRKPDKRQPKYAVKKYNQQKNYSNEGEETNVRFHKDNKIMDEEKLVKEQTDRSGNNTKGETNTGTNRKIPREARKDGIENKSIKEYVKKVVKENENKSVAAKISQQETKKINVNDGKIDVISEQPTT